MNRGCLIFSQYYDSARWIAQKLSNGIPGESIGLYAGGDKSYIFLNGYEDHTDKKTLKEMVRNHELRVLVGTEAASEGKNLQALSSLINLDLPWNPIRLEQRKGRIQRIGQVSPDILVFNMRYRGSVEDKVLAKLSERLKVVNKLFGQIPDILRDVWVKVAQSDIEEAKKKLDELIKHPFKIRYEDEQMVAPVDWESCANVLDNRERKTLLEKSW